MTHVPSYVSGTRDEPLRYQTIGMALQDAAARWPERDALIVPYQDIHWSYGQPARSLRG